MRLFRRNALSAKVQTRFWILGLFYRALGRRRAQKSPPPDIGGCRYLILTRLQMYHGVGISELERSRKFPNNAKTSLIYLNRATSVLWGANGGTEEVSVPNANMAHRIYMWKSEGCPCDFP
jgi:hypothetical protein